MRDQSSSELLAYRRVRRNLPVHQRLRERGLVALVVPVSSIADEIDQEVPLESAAIFPCQPRRLETRRRIVGVDVDDRDLEPARQSARVARAVGLVRSRREAELIVRDDVYSSAGVVAVETRQVERLSHCSLTRERGIAMDEHGKCGRTAETRGAGLVRIRARRASHSHHDRIHRLQVTRVRRHCHERAPARARRPRAGVILHVAHPSEVDAKALGDHGILELGEDLLVGLLENVGEHVQSAAMRHADDGMTSSGIGRT